jgi:Flp pilus assembly protein TadD
MRMRLNDAIFVSAVVATTAMLPPVWAQDNWARCTSRFPDIAIAGCTEVALNNAQPIDLRTMAFNNRGNAYYSKGDFDRAIEDYNHAIQLSPQFNVAYNNRGNAYVAKRDYDQAVLDFGEAIRIRPGHITGELAPTPFDNDVAFENRGLAYFHLNEYDLAIDDMDEAIRLKPNDADYYYNRGVTFNAKGAYDSAIADMTRALQFNSNNAYALYTRGIAKRNKGDIAGAQVDTAAALQSDPDIVAKVGAKQVTTTIADADFDSSRPARPCQIFPQKSDELPEISSATAPPISYVDLQIEQLKKAVPGLNQLKLAAVNDPSSNGTATPSQDLAEAVLSKTGAAIADLRHKIPNLIATEEVIEPVSIPGHNWNDVRIYNYRIVHKKTPSGGDVLEEVRTDLRDQPIDDSAKNADRPLSFGFATVWLFFVPGNLHESRFRYLGEESIERRNTYVLAFAQIPKNTGLGVVIASPLGRCSVPLQGVVWIDQSTFQIVHMQTDLLYAAPDIQLYKLRSVLRYGAAKISGLHLLLWLPTNVETTWETAFHTGKETHLYSHYRLFQATMRILPGFKIPRK